MAGELCQHGRVVCLEQLMAGVAQVERTRGRVDDVREQHCGEDALGREVDVTLREKRSTATGT